LTKRELKNFLKKQISIVFGGTSDIVKKDNIKYFAERQNFHPRGKSASLNDVETTFFVTASLYCVRCKHTYFLKILDEGIK